MLTLDRVLDELSHQMQPAQPASDATVVLTPADLEPFNEVTTPFIPRGWREAEAAPWLRSQRW